jgi:two-component system sensor histidine kinase BaeS
MAEDATPRAGRYLGWLGPLGRRLVAGSAAIALVSVVLLGMLTLLFADIDIMSAGHENEASSTRAIVAAIRSTYLDSPRWLPEDVLTVKDVANTIGVGVEVRAGERLVVRVAPPGGPLTSQTIPVVVSGKEVAVAKLSFAKSGLTPEEVAFRRSIEDSMLLAAGLAVLGAFAVGVVGSRRLVAPLRSLTRATRRLATGDRKSRVGSLKATGELAELATAFDTLAESLEREDSLRKALVADLAHELRTPLAVLQAELEGLAVGVVALDQDAVSRLGEEVGQLSRLVEDLRVLTEAEAAGLTVRREPVDLASVVSNAAARLATLFVDKGVDLSVELAAAEVEGDPDRLEQVVVNLLSNAVKFTPRGGRVRVTAGPAGSHARIVVADTGVGIPEHEQSKIFDRFFRGAGGRDTPGTGIGLAVVAALVEVHGGHVELESSPGRGSVFTVSLPKAARRAQASRAQAGRAQAGRDQANGAAPEGREQEGRAPEGREQASGAAPAGDGQHPLTPGAPTGVGPGA